ncbi:MAG: lysine 2,3-aminomutase [Pirellulales bacterium]|nr:lysine 2,3-aminomutase [Pirellulales bacterium]
MNEQAVANAQVAKSEWTELQRDIAGQLDPTAQSSDWRDWQWQLKHSIRDIELLEYMLGKCFSSQEQEQLRRTVAKFPMSITPYYFSLIHKQAYSTDPIYLQSVPSSLELETHSEEMADPLAEDKHRPVSCISHRYPDRVLFYVSNACAMYCRHCTRKRQVGDRESKPGRDDIEQGIEYIRNTRQVRDVLLSGGDPLMMDDEFLDWLLGRLVNISHVEVIRIGTRMPVVLPYRITDKLCRTLAQYHPLWVHTHFNHPREMTEAAAESLAMLADAGIPLGNQSVLLAGVNDCPRIMRRLVHRLVANRVRPYYIYQCDLAEGLSHFRTPVGKGIEIMESLIGHTSGFAVPQYVIDAPKGGGKVRVMPNYLISCSDRHVVLRNYEGMIVTYKEPDTYTPRSCEGGCERCGLDPPESGAEELDAIGIHQLLTNTETTEALVPASNERAHRMH